MTSFVNFQDDSYYPADQFRRMIARTQDNVVGFDGIDSFKPNAEALLPWGLEVNSGRALVSDGTGGTYWVESKTPTTVPTRGLERGYIILVVLDQKAGDDVNAMTLDAIGLDEIPPLRHLKIGTFHDTGEGVRLEEDVRYTTPGQFVVSPSGPARFGPPVDGMGLGQFSPGSQYTSLDDGVRWIKKEDGTWTRSDAGAGSLDSVNGNYGPDVILDAEDVGAVPNTTPMLSTNNVGMTTNTAEFKGFTSGYTNIDGDGAIQSNRSAHVPNVRLDGASLFGGSRGIIGFPNAAEVPGTVNSGAVLYAADGKLTYRNTGGQAIALGMSLSAHDVTGYGAIGDGVANDAPAIQAALNAARDAGGGLVWVPYGTYKLSTLPLRIFKHTHLLISNGTRMVRGDQTQVLLVNGISPAYGYEGEGNVTVEGGIWDMRGSTAANPENVMGFAHARNVKVLNLEIRNTPGYHAIEFNAIENGKIENCRFEGFTDTGNRDFSEAIQIDIARNSASWAAFGYWDKTPCRFISVTGCYFGEGWPRGIGSHASVLGRPFKNIHIEGNYFYRTTGLAVGGYNWDSVTIANNMIEECGGGIRIRNIDPASPDDTQDDTGAVTNRSAANYLISISGNTFRDIGTVAPAIRVAGANDNDSNGTTRFVYYASIVGNVITNVAGTGSNGQAIRLDRASDAVVSGNIIQGASDAGIWAVDCFHPVISNNTIKNSGTYGVMSRTNDGSKIEGNIIRSTGNYGIIVSGGQYAHVVDNWIRGATTYAIRVSAYSPGGSSPDVPVDSVVVVGNSTIGAYTAGISITSTTGTSRRYGNDPRGSLIEDRAEQIYANPKDTNSVEGKA